MFRILVLLSLFLTGCTQQLPAEDLLIKYLDLSDDGLSQEFDQVLAGPALSSALEASELLEQLNLRQVGETDFHSFESLQQGVYSFCLDVSKTTLIDSDGIDRTPTDRPLQVPMMMRVENLLSSSLITELDIRRFSRC